jgi:hypothetical protein
MEDNFMLWIGAALISAAIAVACAAAAVSMVASARHRRKKAAAEKPAKVHRDWLATGRVNLVGDAEPEPGTTVTEILPERFTLLVEENRLITTLADVPTVETHWRWPTRAEARVIMKRYHDAVKDTIPPHEQLWESSFEPQKSPDKARPESSSPLREPMT